MKHNKLNTKKTSGFKIPKDYFSQLEEEILNEISLKNKAETTGFIIPDNYFETLDQEIANKLTAEHNAKVFPLFNWKKVMYATAIAASLVLMFNIFYNTSNPVTFDSLETASIENYLEQEDYTSYELSEFLTAEELNTTSFTDTEISEETIKDYLLDQSDIEDLIIQ
ncbi:hypothetical protein [Psychroserpens sp. Hel_I_66]|uniref:hypothetical protein n=1 Tax=Psychroserpens sp. Hel_I_66 TaxID=1250004 RepID=UPI0006487AAA|nr:hypothetical protein [Psychroserpens sp. Hel_I_66]